MWDVLRKVLKNEGVRAALSPPSLSPSLSLSCNYVDILEGEMERKAETKGRAGGGGAFLPCRI